MKKWRDQQSTYKKSGKRDSNPLEAWMQVVELWAITKANKNLTTL